MIASGETIIGCQCARRSACRSPTSLLERRLASSDAGWGQVAGAVTAASTRGRTSWPGDTPCGDTLRVGGSVVLDAPFGRFLGDADFPHRRGIPRRVAKCGTRRRAHRHLRRADTRSAQGLGPRPGHLKDRTLAADLDRSQRHIHRVARCAARDRRQLRPRAGPLATRAAPSLSSPPAGDASSVGGGRVAGLPVVTGFSFHPGPCGPSPLRCRNTKGDHEE